MAAVTATMQSRGSASFEDVMTTYVGSSTGIEAQQKLMAVSAIATERTAAQANSIFGKPEVSTIQRMITNKARNVGIGSAITSMIGDSLKPAFANPLQFAPGVGPAFGAVAGAKSLVNPYLKNQTVQVDPATGRPFPTTN